MTRLVEILLSALTAVLAAAGLAMPFVVPDLAIALATWLVVFVALVAMSGPLERVAPGAVRQLWSLELRTLVMGIQVALDVWAPHRGDVVVLLGYAVMIGLTLRLGSFPHARLVGVQPARRPLRGYLAYLPMLLFVLPIGSLVFAIVFARNLEEAP